MTPTETIPTADSMAIYLQASPFIDCNSPTILDFAHKTTQNCETDHQKVVALYYAVRDNIRYDPYNIDLDPNHIKASLTLERGSGYCIEKAMVMAAAARALGIPALLGFANVRNHLASEKFIQQLRSDIFVFHGYVSTFVAGKWVKSTPAFNRSLCEKFQVAPLEFDGLNDSIFQEYDHNGHKYMEYIHYHGEFADLPYNLFVAELKTYYPHFFEADDIHFAGIEHVL